MVNATPEDWDKLRENHPRLVKKWEEFREQYPDMQVDDVVEDVIDADDPVYNPSHYNTGGVECIEGIEASMPEDAFLGYLKGNCMKYLWRYEYKGKPLEDLKKAQWYLDLLIDRIEG